MGKEIAISVRNVSKKYRLFASPRERLKEALHPFRKRYHKEFWALKEVSFDVPTGQTVGIIGRNGSGKSTLLQIIAGIIQPTSGEVAVNGRVSALLDLGAGFNPEFTGRENVVFQAQLVGLSRDEIDRCLPETEAFADIGDFFDQPVKTYSSGMFVRVAFASAINVDPEILIVDEALAVGDIKFQQRCFAKLLAFKSTKKTIIFVSHDLASIAKVCDQVLLMDHGTKIMCGLPDAIINKYLQILAMPDLMSTKSTVEPAKATSIVSNQDESTRAFHDFFKLSDPVNVVGARRSYNTYEHRYGNGKSKIIDYLIVCNDQIDPVVVPSDSKIDLYLKINFVNNVPNPMFGLAVKTKDGVVVYGTNTRMMGSIVAPAVANTFRIVKFSFCLRVMEPDIFIDLGSGEFCNGESQALDRRYSVIHLRVAANGKCTGLTDLACVFQDEFNLDRESHAEY